MEAIGIGHPLGKVPGGLLKEFQRLFIVHIPNIAAIITDTVITITEIMTGTGGDGSMNVIGIGITGVTVMNTMIEKLGTTTAMTDGIGTTMAMNKSATMKSTVTVEI